VAPAKAVLKAEQRISLAWFPVATPRRQSHWLGILTSIALAVLLTLYGHGGMAVLAVGVALLFAAVAWRSPSAHARVLRASQRLGEFLLVALSRILLAPIFLVGVNLAHLMQKISGQDPLQLKRSPPQARGWFPSDVSSRKRRHIRAMFCTEPGSARSSPAVSVLLAVLLAAMVSEAGLRVYGFGKPVLYVADLASGYYPSPNQNLQRFGHTLRINNLGMRGPDLAATPAPGVLRIFLIGDSTLYGGSHVSDEQLYARQLEALLNRAGLRRRVEVASLGVNGWGPFHELGYLQHKGILGAEMVVVCGTMDDLERSMFNLEATPFMSVKHPPRLALEEVFYHLAWRYRTGRLEDDSEVEQQAREGTRAYAQLAELARQKGAREVYLAMLPSRDGDNPKWVSGLRDAVSPVSEGLDYPSGLFPGGDRKRAYHDNWHLSAEGHRLYAEHLSQMLLTRSRLLAGERVQSGAASPW